MKSVQMFKAAVQTKRFRKNQKVWIRFNYDNHLMIYFKWRGSGRYVRGFMSKFNNDYSGANKALGDFDAIKTIEVSDIFADRILKL